MGTISFGHTNGRWRRAKKRDTSASADTQLPHTVCVSSIPWRCRGVVSWSQLPPWPRAQIRGLVRGRFESMRWKKSPRLRNQRPNFCSGLLRRIPLVAILFFSTYDPVNKKRETIHASQCAGVSFCCLFYPKSTMPKVNYTNVTFIEDGHWTG